MENWDFYIFITTMENTTHRSKFLEWNWNLFLHNGDIMEHTQRPTVFFWVFFVWKSWDAPLCCGDFIGKRWVDDCHPLKLGPNRLARANYRSMIAEVPKHIYVL